MPPRASARPPTQTIQRVPNRSSQPISRCAAAAGAAMGGTEVGGGGGAGSAGGGEGAGVGGDVASTPAAWRGGGGAGSAGGAGWGEAAVATVGRGVPVAAAALRSSALSRESRFWTSVRRLTALTSATMAMTGKLSSASTTMPIRPTIVAPATVDSQSYELPLNEATVRS